MRRLLSGSLTAVSALPWLLVLELVLTIVGITLITALWLAVNVCLVLGVFAPLLVPGASGAHFFTLALLLGVMAFFAHLGAGLWPFRARRR